MSQSLTPSLQEALQRLLTLAGEDGAFREALRHLARAFLDATEAPRACPAPPAPTPTAAPAPPPKPAEPPAAPERPLSIRDLDFRPYFGEPRPPTPPPAVAVAAAEAPAPAADQPADPQHVAVCCQLKAEAVRWRLKRLAQPRGNGEGGESGPEYGSLIERARQAQSFLWMIRDETGLGRDPAAAEQLAGCFEATGLAAHLAGQALPVRERLRDEFVQTLELFAEAQSALRVAVRAFHPQGDDDAQFAAFSWLKHATATYHCYVRRHMKVDDPANPAGWAEVVRRLRALEAGVKDVSKRSGQTKKLLGKLRHKVSVILEDPDGHADDWRILAETVDLLVQGGLPPSSLDVREPLLPLIDHVPELEGPHPGFDRVLREIDRYLASQPAPEAPAAPRVDPLVERAAELLQGRSVLLIGGVPNPASRLALRQALRLRDVSWPETREHQSIASFEAEIARPDVCLVLLAIRWSSHSFGDVKHWCDQHDKPLVRLPRGYNPSQVAREVLDQASERLARNNGA